MHAFQERMYFLFSYFHGIFGWCCRFLFEFGTMEEYTCTASPHAKNISQQIFYRYMKSTSAFNCPNESTFWHTTLAQPSRSPHTHAVGLALLVHSHLFNRKLNNGEIVQITSLSEMNLRLGVFKPFSRILTGCESPEKKEKNVRRRKPAAMSFDLFQLNWPKRETLWFQLNCTSAREWNRTSSNRSTISKLTTKKKI